jgi:hypothetical protein
MFWKLVVTGLPQQPDADAGIVTSTPASATQGRGAARGVAPPRAENIHQHDQQRRARTISQFRQQQG